MSESLFRTEPAPEIPTDKELNAEDGDNRLGVFMSQQETSLRNCNASIETIRSVLEVAGIIITDEPPPEPKPPDPVSRPWWRF